MTKTIIVTALRLILSLAISGPAQAWSAQSSSLDCAWGSEQAECDALTVAMVRKRAPAHSHISKTEHAVAPTHLPSRDEDPLASIHFE